MYYIRTKISCFRLINRILNSGHQGQVTNKTSGDLVVRGRSAASVLREHLKTPMASTIDDARCM